MSSLFKLVEICVCRSTQKSRATQSGYTVNNVRKFTTFLYHKGKVKFNDIYMVFLSKGILKLRKIYQIFRNFSQYYETQVNFHKMYLKTTKL